MLIRPLLDTDIPAITMIDQSVQVSPWTEAMFLESLAHHDLGWVLIDEEQLRGYILVKPILKESEADILTIAVDKQQQCKGYGQALLAFVLAQFPCLYLEVRISNQAAIALYKKLGFKIVGKRSNYYQGEDAWVMKALV